MARKPKLIVPIGPAGCGKTVYGERYRKYDMHYVSADSFRHLLYDYDNMFDPERENEVWKMVWAEFMIMVKTNLNIYLDNTNLTRMIRMPFIHVARSFGYRIEMIYFNTPIGKILKQNQSRKRKVPESVVCRQFMEMQYPDKIECDSLEVVNGEIYVKWSES